MSAAIANLVELAILNNTGATIEQQISEGKALFVLDSGSGFSGTFIYRQGTLPNNLLGVNSTGVPGGYWEAVGYRDLVEWVANQNYTVFGHTHPISGVVGFADQVASQIASATIQYSQVNGRPGTVVNSVNGQSGTITITAQDLGVVSQDDFIGAEKISGLDEAVVEIVSLITNIVVDWGNISGKPATATQHPNITDIPGLQTSLENKQAFNSNLAFLVSLGENNPPTGFVEKIATNTWGLATLSTSKISDFAAEVSDLISLSMMDASNYISDLRAIAQLDGEGYLKRDNSGSWSLSTPATNLVMVAGQYGSISKKIVGSTPLEILPALTADSYVHISVSLQQCNEGRLIYFTTDGSNPSVEDEIFSFVLPSGYQNYEKFYAAGTQLKAVSSGGNEIINIQIASVIFV